MLHVEVHDLLSVRPTAPTVPSPLPTLSQVSQIRLEIVDQLPKLLNRLLLINYDLLGCIKFSLHLACEIFASAVRGRLTKITIVIEGWWIVVLHTL